MKNKLILWAAVLMVAGCGASAGPGDDDETSGSETPSTEEAALGSPPTLLKSFDGDLGQGGGTGCGGLCAYRDHPDVNVAASGSQVVESTGQAITVYDYNGTKLKQTSFTQFIKNATGQTPTKIADPRIAYDPWISRWIVGCSCMNDFLMVSASADATGSWHGIALGQSSGDLTMYPGFDKNGVYIAEYGGVISNYTVVALPNADVVALGGGANSLPHKNVFTNFPFETRPALTTDPNAGAEYFVSKSSPMAFGNFNLLIDSITWSGNTAIRGTQHSIATGYRASAAVPAAQPSGVPIKTSESQRVRSGVVVGNHLYSVVATGPCTSSCGTQGVDANQLFFWFNINLGTMTIADKGKVSSPSVAYLFPTLAADASGNFGITATAVGSSTYASAVMFSHHAGDPPGSISAPVTAKAGTAAYSCVNNPVGWGTYASSVQDPGDPTKLWAVTQYGGSATACQWRTRLLRYQP